MRIAVIMLTTIKIDPNSHLYKKGHLSPNHRRLIQYRDGFLKFIKLIRKYNFDTYIIDNSTPLEELDNNIKKFINDNGYVYLNNTPNHLGKYNKGVGLIQAWHDNLELIAKYDYIIHYEPRMQMTEDCVISQFVKNPGNYFRKRMRLPGLETGFFIIDSRSLLRYLIKSDDELINMCKKQISIESDIHQFLLKNNIKINLVEKLGVDWITYYNSIRSL